jgi:hypothetical protein
MTPTVTVNQPFPYYPQQGLNPWDSRVTKIREVSAVGISTIFRIFLEYSFLSGALLLPFKLFEAIGGFSSHLGDHEGLWGIDLCLKAKKKFPATRVIYGEKKFF